MDAAQALAEYGYSLDQKGMILSRDGKASGAMVVRTKSGRVQVRARSTTGALLWSGAENALGIFCAQFWFAERVS